MWRQDRGQYEGKKSNKQEVSWSLSERQRLGVMLVVLPAPGPGLLLQVLPVVLLSGSAVPHLPLDPHGVVTGNRVFVFGTFKKATLQRMNKVMINYSFWMQNIRKIGK